MPSLSFPYMFWAHVDAHASPYCLAVSGMPSPDPAVLGGERVPDLSPPPVEALPAVTERLAELFHVTPERILVTLGASGAMHQVAMRWFRGGRVVTELPSYEPFRALPAFFGAETTLVRRRADLGFRLEPEAFEAAVASGSGPAHVFVSNPNNPTGAVAAADTLVRLAAAAERRGGILISNEVYMEFAPPERRVHAFALAPNTVSIGSLTKAYGLGALRVGWIVLGEGLADERLTLTDLAYLVHVDPPTPSLQAARTALDRLETLLQPARRFEAESRPHLVRWLADTPGVTGELGPFGLTAFPRIEGVDDTHALHRFLAEEEGVAVVPGEFFGMPGHVRVGYALPEATLVEALERLTRGIEAFRG